MVWSTISSDCATSANYDPAGHIPVYTVASPQGVAEIESAFGCVAGVALLFGDPGAKLMPKALIEQSELRDERSVLV